MPKSVFTPAYDTMLRNLIALRKERGVSQVELARQLGKEQPFISRIERGERRLDVVEFYALAQALGIDPAKAYGVLIEDFPAEVSI
ncbi:MAG TPA: helix-turn-helix transcriptional regulator [Caulobacteraceae bacterium]|nr:helix-turn-helix transcriptional regulator [Caulobacteraceae bacterium]